MNLKLQIILTIGMWLPVFFFGIGYFEPSIPCSLMLDYPMDQCTQPGSEVAFVVLSGIFVILAITPTIKTIKDCKRLSNNQGVRYR